MNGFGLAHIKKEGAAVHPDEIEADISDAAYLRQALDYIRDTGDTTAVFARDEVVKQGTTQ